ncbi:GumC domain-containing protein [Pararcticibacter amylolyticus]|uniref:lipopolysaccharide biosynthesis protein n=1 Tax=Pararcticibacter amylolyticus TaxID=2173175 RepID=UPI001304BD30|nr:lipopolysaccharide biosynthesis protein [Pararcticibacter amylolyticus]
MESKGNSQTTNLEDEISFKEFVFRIKDGYNYLVSKWKIIVLMSSIGALCGLLYAYFDKPVYIAECTFVLEEQGGTGGLGQYAGLASMVGIDIGGGNNGLFQGDNIIELYKSRRMIRKTLLSIGSFEGKKDLLINRYIEMNRFRDGWTNNPSLKNISFYVPENQFKRQHDSIINVMVKDIKKNHLIVEKLDKRLSIISVKLSSKDEWFSKVFADKIVENVNGFYVQTKTKKSSENLKILQKQADSVKNVLNLSLGSVASAIDANPNTNPAFQFLKVPSQRRQVDVQASSAIYAEVTKNLEIARIALRKETPLIQMIDSPVLPLERKYVSKAMGIVAGFIVTGLITCVFLSIRAMIKRMLQN